MILEELWGPWWQILRAIQSNANTQSYSNACHYG
jgi:hypothetical protein